LGSRQRLGLENLREREQEEEEGKMVTMCRTVKVNVVFLASLCESN